MKFNKIAKKFAAAALAGVLAVSMMGVSASATEVSPANVTVQKTITKETNVYLPSTTFTFSVSAATAEQISASGSSKVLVAAADIPTDGVTFSDNSIISSPSATDIGQTSVTLSDTATLTVDSTKFTTPGIYRYVVTEIIGSYDGMDYSTEVKYFDVYVNSDGEIYAYTFVDESEDSGKDDGIFTNKYGETGTDNEFSELTLTKTVSGNQGDKSKEFSFSVMINGETDEEYYVVRTSTDSTRNNTSWTLTSGTAQTITLKDGESIKVYGLDDNDTYTVVETSYASEGYSTTVTGSSNVTDESTGKQSTGTISTDTTVAYTNTKTVDTPTGIALSIAPYVLMVAFAGVIAVLFLRKRRYEI